jgi:hypothetical protein
MTNATPSPELQAQLQKTTDKAQRTNIIAQWLYRQDDDVKLRFSINAGIPHSWFNVMCGYLPSTDIQNIDWFLLLKNKARLIIWSRDMKGDLLLPLTSN